MASSTARARSGTARCPVCGGHDRFTLRRRKVEPHGEPFVITLPYIDMPPISQELVTVCNSCHYQLAVEPPPQRP
jgi:hypothetical protein